MRLADWCWEIVDNGVYALSVVACVVLAVSAGACPTILLEIRHELQELRAAVEKIQTCECKCRPHLLPRLRGEVED